MKKLVLAFSVLFISLNSYSQEITTYYFIRTRVFTRYYSTIFWFYSYYFILGIFSFKIFDVPLKVPPVPTADSKNLPILLYRPDNMYSEAFQNNTKGKTVLVVGHSNTTNVFANKVLGEEKYDEINDSNNSNLYIVTVIDGKPSAILLKIN